MKQTIAVTGATGFIGQSICRRLSDRGFSVRALVRSSRKASLPALVGTEIVVGDLANQESLQNLVTGADAIIHCAGNVRGATQAQFDDVNVEGTRNILRAIKSTAITPRLLAISSLAAREPQLSFYASSKRRAEQVLHDEGSDVPWTILRPPAVYGPGDRELLPLFRLMSRGIALTAGPPSARFSMLFVEDLSAAVIAWLLGDIVTEGTYAIDDGQPRGYDWHDVSRIVSRLCGRKIRVVQTPSWLLDIPAWVNSRLGITFGTSPMLTPQKLRELRHNDWVCDGTEFQQTFDWEPIVQLEKGLRSTPNWATSRLNSSTEI